MSTLALDDAGATRVRERLTGHDLGLGLLVAVWILGLSAVALWGAGARSPRPEPPAPVRQRSESTVAVPVSVANPPPGSPALADAPKPSTPPPTVSPPPTAAAPPTPTSTPPTQRKPPPAGPTIAVPGPDTPPPDAATPSASEGGGDGLPEDFDWAAFAAAAAAEEEAAIKAYRARLLKWLQGRFMVEDSGLSKKELAAIRVKVLIHVAEDGTVADYDLTETGHDPVDRAARDALTALRGQTLPTPPFAYPAALPPQLRVTFVCRPGVCS